MKTLHVFDDIQHLYSEFVENKKYLKLQSLNNLGKNRFFFNQQYFSLDTGNSPDFIDRKKYMARLMGELLI